MEGESEGEKEKEKKKDQVTRKHVACRIQR